MAGYFHPRRPGFRGPYAAIVSDLRPKLTGFWTESPAIEFYRFGKVIAPIPVRSENEAEIADERFYTHRCLTPSGAAGKRASCDVDQSQIGLALEQARNEGQDTLSVVITDLFLTAQDLGAAALSAPLTHVVISGRAVGILGIRAPFIGTVYDIPARDGETRYELKPKSSGEPTYRPVFMLVIGLPEQVRHFLDQVQDLLAQSMAAGDYHSVLFASHPLPEKTPPFQFPHPIRLTVPSDGSGMREVHRSYFPPDIPAYRLRTDQRPVDIVLDQDRVEALMPPSFLAADLSVDEQVWVGFRDGTCVSKWRDESATLSAPLAKVAASGGGGQILELFPPGPHEGSPMRSLKPGLKYFVSLSVRANAISPTQDDQWLNDWSLSQANVEATLATKPRFFPALNLQVISRMLEKIVQENTAENPDKLTVAHLSLAFDLE